MIIVYDKLNQKVINNMGTNEKFPDGNISHLPELPENQIYVRVHDRSEFARKINSAREYNVVFNEDEVVDIIVNKTHKQAIDEENEKPENKIKQIRETRDKLLRESDYLMLSDAPITLTEKNDWVKYRKDLRDITKQDIKNIVWPEKPEIRG